MNKLRPELLEEQTAQFCTKCRELVNTHQGYKDCLCPFWDRERDKNWIDALIQIYEYVKDEDEQ